MADPQNLGSGEEDTYSVDGILKGSSLSHLNGKSQGGFMGGAPQGGKDGGGERFVKGPPGKGILQE